jgi:hypothetical protein
MESIGCLIFLETASLQKGFKQWLGMEHDGSLEAMETIA